MELRKKTYIFGGKTWIQRPLVLAQYDQLAEVLRGKPMPQTFDAAGVIASFGPDIHKALAIALTPEGMRPKDKDLPEIEEKIRWSIEIPEMIRAVEDFFELSPLHLLFEMLTETMQRVSTIIQQAKAAEDMLKA